MSFFKQFLLMPSVDSVKKREIQQLIQEFVEVLGNATDKAGIKRETLRLFRPLYLFTAIDNKAVYLVISNRGAIRGQTQWFYYEHVATQPLHPNAAFDAAIRQLGFYPEDTRSFTLPTVLLEMATEERQKALEDLAMEYLERELKEIERQRRLVRIVPIFKGRDFLLEENLCFVLMPLGKEFQPIYEDHIKKVIVEECSMKCLKADDIFSNREIIEDIWELINRARIIIAEITGKYPNVYYEIGICHAIGKDVILITQSMDDVPFDLRHLRVICYEYTPRGCKELEKKLAETVKTVLQKSPYLPIA